MCIQDIYKLQVPWYINFHFIRFLQESAISSLVLQDHGIWAIILRDQHLAADNDKKMNEVLQVLLTTIVLCTVGILVVWFPLRK